MHNPIVLPLGILSTSRERHKDTTSIAISSNWNPGSVSGVCKDTIECNTDYFTAEDEKIGYSCDKRCSIAG
jgi:hypothetical protein